MEVIDLVYQEELVAFIELRCNSDLDLRKIHARLVGRELAFWHRVPPRRTDISQIQAEDTFQLADGLRKCIGTVAEPDIMEPIRRQATADAMVWRLAIACSRGSLRSSSAFDKAEIVTFSD